MRNAWRVIPLILALWILYAFTPGCTSVPLPPQSNPGVKAPIATPDPLTITPTPDPLTPAHAYHNIRGELIINQAGLDLTKYYEGLYLKAYKDGVNVWTICYGRIDYPSGAKVKAGDKATEAECNTWLLLDLNEEGLLYVNKLAKPQFPDLNENELSALVSFTFNRGPGRLRLALAESKTKKELADNLLHYDYAGTATNHLLGLKRRRRSERALFLNQDWTAYKGWKQ